MDFLAFSTLVEGIRKHQGKSQEKEEPDDFVEAEEDYEPKLKSSHGHDLVGKSYAPNYSGALG